MTSADTAASPTESAATPSLDDRLLLVDTPLPDVRFVMVTSGTGASTAFAIGEENIAAMTA